MLHKNSDPTNNHVVQSWEPADAAALAAIAGLTAADVGKLAYQVDTEVFYHLTDHAPITWKLLGGSGTGLPAGGTTGQALVKSSGADGDADWGDIPQTEIVVSATEPVSPTLNMLWLDIS